MKVHRPLLARNGHQLGVALLASACAHAVLLGGVLLLTATQEPAGTAAGQRKGALTVVSLGTAPVPTKLAPSTEARAGSKSDVPRAVRPPMTPMTPMTAAQPATSTAMVPPTPAAAPAPDGAPPEPAPATAALPAAERPGARFASLFAPILNRPLGRGRWGSASPPTMPQPDPQSLRQQAALALTQTLRQRLDGLDGAACHVRLDTDSRDAVVDCEAAADAAQIWAMVQGLLHPGDPRTDGSAVVCFEISQARALVQTCTSTFSNRTGP